MCGILGYFQKQPDLIKSTRVERALRLLNHRGPDDFGYEIYQVNDSRVCFGHTRLSIIDLSSAGHQPMHSDDGRWAIVFNGEIYNYRELRSDLQLLGHTFKSDSDTEVLLAAWLQWGENCLTRLTGMFAFAILDKALRKLVFVRDAFGIKPLFYSNCKNGLFFSSEIPSLIELMATKPNLNWQRSYDYLVHGDYDSNRETFYEDIFHLPPGHLLTVDLIAGRIEEPFRWWTPNIVERTNWCFEGATEQVRETFLKNIQFHMRSDVPLGAALSGGIDSSAVVCAMRYLDENHPIHTFSFIASGSDLNEEHWVDRVNSHVGAISHKVHVSPLDLVRDLDDMIQAQGEPFSTTSIYAQYRVFKLARDAGITVTLDGQGADEMLAGYNGYPGQRLRSLLETGRLTDAFVFLNEWGNWPGRSKVAALKTLVGQVTSGCIYSALHALNCDKSSPRWINRSILEERGVKLGYPNYRPRITKSGRRVIAELAASLSERGLVSLLRHADRNSMKFSVESRVPFLTVEMAELLLSMPERFLISEHGETKHVFREAMRGIVPSDILDRKDKIGFATPERDLLLPICEQLRSWLKDPMSLPFINQEEILREFDEVISGNKNFSGQIWRWVNFSRWYNTVSTRG